MNRYSWRNLVRRYSRPRRDNLASLSEDIHQQAEREWDAEDNTEETPPLMSVSPDGSFATIQTTPGSGVYPMGSTASAVWVDESAQLRIDPPVMSDYVFALNNGEEIRISLIDDNDGIEITFNDEAIQPLYENGRITLRSEQNWDEENNASQDTRAHDEPTEDSSHSSEDVLLGDTTVQITYSRQ